jgi:hypothetical protein
MRSIASVAAAALLAASCGTGSSPEARRPAWAAPALAAPDGSLSGRVLESLDADGLTYLRLETPSGTSWAGVDQATVRPGASVAILEPQPREVYDSPELGRRLQPIVFGRLSVLQVGVQLPPDHPRVGGSARVDSGPITVRRAKGPEGRTVAEVHAQRKALAGQPVVVRGRVVKFLPGIMRRNWVHLRDGTGSAAGADEDLTVTTSAPVAVGTEVTVRGVVSVDRDFGAGYRYAVIVEDAEIAP